MQSGGAKKIGTSDRNFNPGSTGLTAPVSPESKLVWLKQLATSELET